MGRIDRFDDFAPAHVASPASVALAVVLRRWRLFAWIALPLSAIAIIGAALRPAHHGFTTIIQIGEQVVPATAVTAATTLPIDAPDALLAKIRGIYLPEAQRALGSDDLDVVAENPVGTSLVALRSRGTVDDGDVHRRLHEAIAAAIVADHAAIVQQWQATGSGRATHETRVLRVAAMSTKPVGLGRAAFAAIGCAVAAVAALAVCLAWDALANAARSPRVEAGRSLVA